MDAAYQPKKVACGDVTVGKDVFSMLALRSQRAEHELSKCSEKYAWLSILMQGFAFSSV